MDLLAQISGSDGWKAPWAASLGDQFPFLAGQLICAVTLYPEVMPRKEQGQSPSITKKRKNCIQIHKKTTETITSGETYTLCSWERQVPELLEEKHACHCWDQVHDEVVVHHAPRIQLQTFEVVRAEMAFQLGATESCEGERQVRSGL